VLAGGRANEFNPVLKQLAIGDAAYGFRVLFPEPLSEAERDRIFVRPAGSAAPLAQAPALATVFEPVSHVAMDIVNNCNLRCPFCVYDYSNTRHTRVMSDATFDSALRLIPYVTDGNFWLSCLHEATMHPELVRFIERIPRQWRRKVMYTTNLARPMPDAYFDMLAESGIHHLNISLESLDPKIYERMRKGARWRIFANNWDRLLQAIRAGSNPPRLRYNIMAYQSNLAEIPGLVRYLRDERLAWQVEVRHTFDVTHIPAEFRDAEFLGDDGWAWLAKQLKPYPAEDVLLIPPPVPDAPPAQPDVAAAISPDPVPRQVTRPLNIRMEWDGSMTVYGEWTGPAGTREHEQFVVTNVHHLRDPRGFLTSL
jgi:pyruvate-formate lyase-activating enzyme